MSADLCPLAERRLIARIQAGDESARWALIEAHAGLVVALARRWQGRGVPVEDLIQEGTIALIQAVDRFDWRRGARFGTFASLVVKHALAAAGPGLRSLVSVPTEVLRDSRLIERAVERLTQSLQREPSADELERFLAATVGREPASGRVLDEPLSLDAAAWDDSAETVGEALPDPAAGGADEWLGALDRRPVRDAVAALPERERRVLELRYGLDGRAGLDPVATARRLGLSPSVVRQLEESGLRRVRVSVGAESTVVVAASTGDEHDQPARQPAEGAANRPTGGDRSRLAIRLRGRPSAPARASLPAG